MKYGIHLAGGAAICDRQVLRDVAQCAEDEGFDVIMAGDHAVLPMHIESPWPYEEWNGGKPFYDVYTQIPWADMFTVLSFAAAYTETVRIATGVMIVPYRNPFDVARRLATLDVLSGGRLVVGCGAGWMKEEFDLLGVPFERRGRRTDEYVEAMKAMWTQADPRYSGEFVKLDVPTNPHPQPLQKPHPPIWIGGESKAAMRRVARVGDGWHVALLTERQFRELYGELERQMEAAGRDLSELELTTMVEPTRMEPSTLKFAADHGVSTLILTPLAPDPAGFVREMREFAKWVRDGA